LRLRRHIGLARFAADRQLGRFAAARLERIAPALCYAFTQVALESLAWAERRGVPAILESPNGHIRAFRAIYENESRRWCEAAYRGHPTHRMVARVEREYALATRVRVSSEWSRRSLAGGAVGADRITVLQQPVDLERYAFVPRAGSGQGPLRICCVGSIDLRKGFVYLLRAVRAVGAKVELVGGTGDRHSRKLLAREIDGLDVEVRSGDPRPALARAEIFVLPTLEDGSPFAVAEAMASGLPVVTTSSTGAAEWITEGRTGWIVEPASVASLEAALRQAGRCRAELPEMGRQARRDTEDRVRGADEAVARWLATL